MRSITEIQWFKLSRRKNTIKNKMKDFKQQFKDFRNSTPKHIQWILLGAAFVVVIILLALLLGPKLNRDVPGTENESISLNTAPSAIKLTDVQVGSSSSESITVSVNTPIMLDSIDIDAPGINITNDCDDVIESCIINVIYRPTAEQSETETKLIINWYVESQPDIIKQKEVSVTYSSWKQEEPKPVVKPEPVIIEPEPVIIEPEPDYDSAADDIKNIAVENPFKEEPDILKPEKCSEFAIPGYDQSGRQIGWIKPEHGANYFHPFSDKDCSNPTGRYDMATGIITSLEDGSKIGTDSDHIGYRNIRSRNLTVPKLNMPGGTSATLSNGTFGDNAVWQATDASGSPIVSLGETKKFDRTATIESPDKYMGSAKEGGEYVLSSPQYDRTFILRQFKPIPATIVSEVRADPSVYGCDGSGSCDPNTNYSIPVRATVDRNVYSDNGRTIILPAGTLLMGYLDGNLPGPYQAFGRMNIKWYQFIRPDGVEFNFSGGGQDPYSADAQGRMGVPGHGSTDYVEQMVMPILTSLVPAAVNMIAPIADTVINQIDLDNNTIVQSGTIRSSEMAKQELINTWNKISQKLLVDAIDNTIPPFSIAAGTRINVFSPVDLIVSCGEQNGDASKKCLLGYGSGARRKWSDLKNVNVDYSDPSWVGQVRSFDYNKYCTTDAKGKITIGSNWAESGSDYRTILMYCESQNYQAKNNAKQAAYNTQIQKQAEEKYGTMQFNQQTGIYENSNQSAEQQRAYNEDILGLTYDDEGYIENPWDTPVSETAGEVLTCEDGTPPDINGCCTGETYTDMGDAGFNCCPEGDGDCFPPITVQ